jgi:hypothetical protein
LVEAASGLGEGALADESAESVPGDVHGGFVGGQFEEFVQLTSTEGMSGRVVEDSQEPLVGVRGRGGLRLGPGAGDVFDDLACGLQFCEVCPCLGEGCREIVDLLLQAADVRGGVVLRGLELLEEFGDVHAADPVSRQAGVGAVSRRAMLAVAAQ